MNVLITSASRKVWLVQAFQQALREEGGGRVIATDINPWSAALYAADEGVLGPPSDAPDYIEAMLRLCRERRVDLLIPTRDEELPVLARAKARFQDEAGVQVMVADAPVLERILDKATFNAHCRRTGLQVPRLYDCEEVRQGRVPFPVFARSCSGKGSAHASRVPSPEDFRQYEQRVPQCVVQEYVAAPEYTLDLFADFQGRLLSVVPRERKVVVAGESYVGVTRKNPRLIEAGRRTAAAFELVGHNTIQCFLRGDEVLLIEVNARYGGGAHLGFAAGADSPRWLVRLARGAAVERAVDEFTDGLVMLRHTQDILRRESELLA